MTRESEAERLLRELLALLDQSEQCDQCVGPDAAFVDGHARTYERIRKRARKLLAAPLPN